MAGPMRNREINYLKNNQKRCVSFTKRRNGLFSKSRRLSEVFNADVAAIVFNNRGRKYEFASNNNMEDILTRAGHGHVNLEQQLDSGDNDALNMEITRVKGQIAVLNLHCSQLRGENLDGLSLEELNQLEGTLNRGFELIRQNKSQKLPTHNFFAVPRNALDTTMEDVDVVRESSSSSSPSVHQNSDGVLSRMRRFTLYGSAVNVVSYVGGEKIDPNWLSL